MDHHPPRGQDLVIDLESGTGVTCNINERSDFTKLSDQFISVNPLNINEGCPENNVKVVIDTKLEGDFTGKKTGKDKRKKASSAKKPPKPPRPPRGFSLDAADQKLIKELAELAMMKRARIERMKKKALKASASSSNGSLFALLFTVIFLLVILLQGMLCRSPRATFQGSPQTAQTNENGLIFIQEQLNPSASDSILRNSKSSNLVEKISGSESTSKKSTAAG